MRACVHAHERMCALCDFSMQTQGLGKQQAACPPHPMKMPVFTWEFAIQLPSISLKISSSLKFSSQIRGKLPLFTDFTIND